MKGTRPRSLSTLQNTLLLLDCYSTNNWVFCLTLNVYSCATKRKMKYSSSYFGAFSLFLATSTFFRFENLCTWNLHSKNFRSLCLAFFQSFFFYVTSEQLPHINFLTLSIAFIWLWFDTFLHIFLIFFLFQPIKYQLIELAQLFLTLHNFNVSNINWCLSKIFCGFHDQRLQVNWARPESGRRCWGFRFSLVHNKRSFTESDERKYVWERKLREFTEKVQRVASRIRWENSFHWKFCHVVSRETKIFRS